MKNVLFTATYTLILYCSAIGGFFFLGLPTENLGVSQNMASHIVNVTIRNLTLLVSWDVMVGLFFLWHSKRSNNDPNAGGYGIATALVTLIALFILQACRAQMNHMQFVVLLLALGFRGMIKGSWENNRPKVGMLSSFASHSLLAALSFSVFYNGTPPWQTVPLSVAVGSIVSSAELAQNRSSINVKPYPGLSPLYRVITILGPLIITTSAFVGLLERSYTYFLITLFMSVTHVRKSDKQTPIPPEARYMGAVISSVSIVGLLAIRASL